MKHLDIDQEVVTVAKRQALRLRSRRLDISAKAAAEYAAKQARRELVEQIMQTNRGVTY